MKLSVATRNAMVDAAVDRLDVGGAGSIVIYSGAQPTNPDTALSGQTALASFSLAATAFGAAANGTAALQSTPRATTGTAAGTATWFRAYANGTTTAIFDGTVGTAAADLILNTTTISVGLAVEITSGSFSMPTGS